MRNLPAFVLAVMLGAVLAHPFSSPAQQVVVAAANAEQAGQGQPATITTRGVPSIDAVSAGIDRFMCSYFDPLKRTCALSIKTVDPKAVKFQGLKQLSALTVSLLAGNPDTAEVAGYFDINGTAGGGRHDQSVYKAAVIAHVVVSPDGGPGFGGNFVCELAPQPARDPIGQCHGLEVDVNNADADRAGDVYHDPRRSLGILINGSGLHTNNAAVEVAAGAGTFSLWNTGFRFSQHSNVPSIVGAAFEDDTGSASSLSLGPRRHAIGIDGANATYSQYEVAFPGWKVGPAGDHSARSVAVAVPGGFSAPLGAPANSSAPCKPGAFADDVNFHYLCTAPNHWKRIRYSGF